MVIWPDDFILSLAIELKSPNPKQVVVHVACTAALITQQERFIVHDDAIAKVSVIGGIGK